MTRRNVLLFGGLALVLAIVNIQILRRETILAEGRPTYLRLAPVDPRSLMKGDYLVLRYRLPESLEPASGLMVLARDERGVAEFVRVHVEGEPLAENEQLLRYGMREGSLSIGAEAFFFEEGLAEELEGAEYAELRIDADGNATLVGLADAELRPLARP